MNTLQYVDDCTDERTSAFKCEHSSAGICVAKGFFASNDQWLHICDFMFPH